MSTSFLNIIIKVYTYINNLKFVKKLKYTSSNVKEASTIIIPKLQLCSPEMGLVKFTNFTKNNIGKLWASYFNKVGNLKLYWGTAGWFHEFLYTYIHSITSKQIPIPNTYGLLHEFLYNLQKNRSYYNITTLWALIFKISHLTFRVVCKHTSKKIRQKFKLKYTYDLLYLKQSKRLVFMVKTLFLLVNQTNIRVYKHRLFSEFCKTLFNYPDSRLKHYCKLTTTKLCKKIRTL